MPDGLKDQTVLVSGATGFVGGAFVRRLAANGVSVLATGRNQVKAGTLQAETQVQVQVGDLTDKDFVEQLVSQVDYVVHSAAKSDVWGPFPEFHAANVIATQTLVAACQSADIKRLVHISTPSLYFCLDSRQDVRENDPLPDRFPNYYVQTKRQAESIVIDSSVDHITLRPRAIYGPGDQALLPRLIDRMAKQRLPQIGTGDNVADLTYIENLLDAIELAVAVEAPAQRVFNIADGTPCNLWQLLQLIGTELELPLIERQLSYATAMRIAGFMELIWRVGRLPNEPLLTRYSVSVLGLTQTLDISAARDVLGYAPKYSTEAGVSITLKQYAN